jgi:hypothetical protein
VGNWDGAIFGVALGSIMHALENFVDMRVNTVCNIQNVDDHVDINTDSDPSSWRGLCKHVIVTNIQCSDAPVTITSA